MKTKQKTVKAANATVQGIVPKLRFPEFQDEGEWEEKKLGDITYKVGKKNKEGIKFPIYSINNKEGFLPQSDQFDGMDSNNRGYDITLYKIIERNTFAYNPARINVGSLGYSEELHNIIISSLYVCFKSKDSIDDSFLLFFLKTNSFNESVKNSVEGGIRNYLFYENFARINIYLPEKPEQQKIVDCLSSIGELITAHAQKLDTLKTHKKGLMQQLFPAEGETVPKLRLPEFRDAGAWEEKSLGQVVKFLDGQRKPIKEFDRASMQGQYPYYGASGIIDYINDFIFDETLILLGEDGENIVSRNLPLVFKISGKCWVNNHAHVLKPKKPNHLEFLVQYLESLSYIKYNSGGAQPKLNQAVCKTIPLILPSPPEQQKIADCLSSIDELIAAQSQKLDTLKTHKNGLMQQLFPSTDEVNG